MPFSRVAVFVLPACLFNRIRDPVIVFLCRPLFFVAVIAGLVFLRHLDKFFIPGFPGLTLVVVLGIYSLFFRIGKVKIKYYKKRYIF